MNWMTFALGLGLFIGLMVTSMRDCYNIGKLGAQLEQLDDRTVFKTAKHLQILRHLEDRIDVLWQLQCRNLLGNTDPSILGELTLLVEEDGQKWPCQKPW